MKTLYESLLGDLEDNLAKGDKFSSDSEWEFKNFGKMCTTLKNYSRLNTKIYESGYMIDLPLPNTLEIIGRNANGIKILFYQYFRSKNIELKTWRINIELYGFDKDTKSLKHAFENGIFVKESFKNELKSASDVCKKIFKPAVKDYNTFKDFLNIIERNNTRDYKNYITLNDL